MTRYSAVSFFGIFVLLGFAWLMSTNRKKVNWRVMGWGIGLQLLYGFFVFKVPAGIKVFAFVNRVVVKALASAGA